MSWPDIYWYVKAIGILFVGWLITRHYMDKFRDHLKEFMRDMIQELIAYSNTQFAYRDKAIRKLERELNAQKYRTTALALTNVEFATSMLFPGDNAEINRNERIRMVDHFRNIATQVSIESEDFERLKEN